MFVRGWPGEPRTADQYGTGRGCLSCSRFAAFDTDWGLCCNRESRHFTETVIEHFTCPWFHNQALPLEQDVGPSPKPFGHR
jgi:hypothetical protein